jgi:hypothetical protein
MIEFEATLRAGLQALADETEAQVSPPPTANLRLRAGRVRRPGSRRLKIAAAVVAATVATTGAAAAVGVLPAPVESMLDEFRSWGFPANRGAERMAVVTSGELTYELWRAPLEPRGRCVYVRVSGPGGDFDHGGSSICSRTAIDGRSVRQFQDLTYPTTVVDNSDGHASGAPLHAVAWGRLPTDATEAVFAFSDGTTTKVSPQHDGYFITTFPDVPDGAAITGVTAVDPAGDVVARAR